MAKVVAREHQLASAPSTCRQLRLLCVRLQSRNGVPRSIPVHTLRPMPPRVSGQGQWHLIGNTCFYLRETHATAPAPEVLARYLPLGQSSTFVPDRQLFESW